MTPKERQRAREQADADILWLFDQPAGRRILYQMFAETGMLTPTTNPEHLPFGEGGRAYATHWHWLIFSRAPDKLSLLLTENAHFAKAADGGRDDSGDGYEPGDGAG